MKRGAGILGVCLLLAAPAMKRGAGILGVCLLLAAPVMGARPRPNPTLGVFAAASLTESFREIAHLFQRDHPGVAVRLNLAGSQQLASQIEQGAPADVFASADGRWMDHVRERSMLLEAPVVFARNRLAIVVPRTNPARIERLQDLARRGVKVVIGAETVPVGAYGRQMLQKLSARSDFGADFGRRVLANVVSEEENVRSVLGKVQLGEADAGIVYASDITPAVARLVRSFAIPDGANVIAQYPIAVLKDSGEPERAREFVRLVLAPEGQRILAAHGLMPVGPTAP